MCSRFAGTASTRTAGSLLGQGTRVVSRTSPNFLLYEDSTLMLMETSRYNPYERSSRPFATQSNNQDTSPAPRDSPQRKQIDVTTMSRLFQQLVPLSKDPSTFESAAAAVCASFDLDATTSAEIVSLFKEQSRVESTSVSKCVSGSNVFLSYL